MKAFAADVIPLARLHPLHRKTSRLEDMAGRGLERRTSGCFNGHSDSLTLLVHIHWQL